MNIKTMAVALATSTILAGGASAATISETFNFITHVPGGGSSGYSVGFPSLTFTGSNSNDVTVTAGQYNTFSYTYATDSTGNERVAHGDAWGLGAYNSSGDHDHHVDGSGKNDILLFTFGQAVTVTSVTFGSYSGSFDLYGSDNPADEDCCISFTGSTMDLTSYGASGTTIGLGAFYGGSKFKVREMTVTYEETPVVPLPAAGWMLLAGLGGLGALKRRKKS